MADGKRFVVECRWVYASSCYGSLTIPCTKLLKNVGRGSGVGRVGIPYNTPLGSKVPGSVSSEICDNFFSDSYFYMRFFATC